MPEAILASTARSAGRLNGGGSCPEVGSVTRVYYRQFARKSNPSKAGQAG